MFLQESQYFLHVAKRILPGRFDWRNVNHRFQEEKINFRGLDTFQLHCLVVFVLFNFYSSVWMRGGHFLWYQYFRYPIRRPPTSNMLSIGHARIPIAKYQRRRDSIVEILRSPTRINIQVCVYD